MNPNLTEIIVVLDRSGSMESVRSSTIEGVNSFITEQQRAPGEARWTLVQFDHEYSVMDSSVPIANAELLNNDRFFPRGWTALYGAIGTAIEDAGRRFDAMPESAKPGKVVLVIVTDGQENSSQKYEWSKRFTRESVRSLVEQQKSQWGWEVVYIGANQDAVLNATSLGISPNNAMNYTANDIGTQSMYAAVSRNTVSLRSGTAKSMAFSQEQHKAQKKAAKS